jgi:hypothetical protein
VTVKGAVLFSDLSGRAATVKGAVLFSDLSGRDRQGSGIFSDRPQFSADERLNRDRQGSGIFSEQIRLRITAAR